MKETPTGLGSEIPIHFEIRSGCRGGTRLAMGEFPVEDE